MPNSLHAIWAQLRLIYGWKDEKRKGRSISLISTLLTSFYNVFITGIFYTGFLSTYEISLVGVGIITYWLPIVIPVLRPYSEWPFAIFFLHGVYLSYMFLSNYFKTQNSIEQTTVEANAPSWWTPETKRRLLSKHHSFITGCVLIVIFGLGSIVITAAFPTQVWPYTLLSGSGMLVFWFLYYAVSEYGGVIEIASYAMKINSLDGSRRQK